MATYKRIDGDYNIVAVHAGDSITLDATDVGITGNLVVDGSLAFGAISSLDVTGNITALNATIGNSVTANFFVGNRTITSLGNIVANNYITGREIQAGGNIQTGQFFLGDGRYISNVVANVGGASILQKGTTNIDIPVNNGNILVQVNSVANTVIFTETGVDVTGQLTAATVVTNVISSDDSAFVSVEDGLNVIGDIEATGNVTGTYFLGDGSLLSGIITSVSNINNGTSEMSVISSGGNIRGNIAGNTVLVLSSAGANVTGNVTATYFLGNGSLLSGIITSVANINNGTSNVTVVSSGGNVVTSVGGTANVLVVTTTGANVTGTLNATGNANVGNLGATNIVGTLATAAQPNITSLGPLTGLSVTGNITQTGNLNITGNINATGNLNYQNVTDLVVGDPLIFIGANNTANLFDLGFIVTYDDGLDQHGGFVRNHLDGVWGVFGNVVAEPTTVIDWGNAIYQPFRAGNITTTGIINANANGVGNIGSSTTYFNTVFAQSTSALYADVAEVYLADQDYAPGTVLRFGGSHEVTASDTENDYRVAGVVSTNPAHLMNSGLQGAYPVKLALIGRVPCQVRGPVHPGDILVSDEQGWAQVNNNAQAGRIIGKSLESSESDSLIEIVVGKH
jgi:hypothetical protein